MGSGFLAGTSVTAYSPGTSVQPRRPVSLISMICPVCEMVEMEDEGWRFDVKT